MKRCKNIVVCCDGTGNEFDPTKGGFSNVVRLYTALCVDNGQVGYYHPGVGTMGAATAKNRFEKQWARIKGLAFGSGFRDNVLDAYRYLMDTYDDGDHVYLFGFSRGAYTARALAGFLHGYGLLCRGNEGHIPYAWREYTARLQKAHDDNANLAKDKKITKVKQDTAFRDTFSHPHFSIHFVGLWDTVSSVGWITEPLQLLHIAQNPSMCIARHAISIDERRCFFQDNLWGEALPHQDFLQAWFPGVHSDVGGSYANSESYLSNKTLEWLLAEAEAAGIRLEPKRRKMIIGFPPTDPEHAAAPYYAPPPLPDCDKIPHHSLHGAWWLLEFLPHRFYNKDEGKQHYRIPLGAPRQIPDGAIIHPSVVAWMNTRGSEYAPSNLSREKLERIDTLLPGENPRAKGMYRYKKDPQALLQADSFNPLAKAAIAALFLIGSGFFLLRKGR